MSVLDELRARLDAAGAQYELIHHTEPIRSAEDGERVMGIRRADTTPTLILVVGGQVWAAILPGDRRLDAVKAGRTLGGGRAQLVAAEIVRTVTGVAPGAVPLVSSVPTVMDTRLFDLPFCYGGAGDEQWTLKITPTELQRVTQARVADIGRGEG